VVRLKLALEAHQSTICWSRNILLICEQVKKAQLSAIGENEAIESSTFRCRVVCFLRWRHMWSELRCLRCYHDCIYGKHYTRSVVSSEWNVMLSGLRPSSVILNFIHMAVDDTFKSFSCCYLQPQRTVLRHRSLFILVRRLKHSRPDNIDLIKRIDV
jgi:hypothetical protein